MALIRLHLVFCRRYEQGSVLMQGGHSSVMWCIHNGGNPRNTLRIRKLKGNGLFSDKFTQIWYCGLVQRQQLAVHDEKHPPGTHGDEIRPLLYFFIRVTLDECKVFGIFLCSSVACRNQNKAKVWGKRECDRPILWQRGSVTSEGLLW